jgi:hypothetical protein
MAGDSGNDPVVPFGTYYACGGGDSGCDQPVYAWLPGGGQALVWAPSTVSVPSYVPPTKVTTGIVERSTPVSDTPSWIADPSSGLFPSSNAGAVPVIPALIAPGVPGEPVAEGPAITEYAPSAEPQKSNIGLLIIALLGLLASQ